MLLRYFGYYLFDEEEEVRERKVEDVEPGREVVARVGLLELSQVEL